MKTVLPLLSEYLGTILISKYSGGMINPAVSYVMYLQSKISLKEFLYFIAIQMIAALSSYGVYTIVA